VSVRRTPGFDRLPRRDQTPAAGGSSSATGIGGVSSVGPPDADGRRALFSTAEQPPTIGTVVVACSSCHERTVVSLLRAARLAVPSLHLPGLRPSPWSFMRCPACGRLAWVSLSLRV
jgi:hypothetical protein